MFDGGGRKDGHSLVDARLAGDEDNKALIGMECEAIKT